MNNEPVAWIGETLMGRQYINGQKGILPVGTPLYTHPAKTLTELEILDVWVSSNFVRYAENGQIDEIFFNKFANAILRKAQEK